MKRFGLSIMAIALCCCAEARAETSTTEGSVLAGDATSETIDAGHYGHYGPIHSHVQGPGFTGHCCDHEPSCCDGLWDGYCQHKPHCQHARPAWMRLPKLPLFQAKWGKGHGCCQPDYDCDPLDRRPCHKPRLHFPKPKCQWLQKLKCKVKGCFTPRRKCVDCGPRFRRRCSSGGKFGCLRRLFQRKGHGCDTGVVHGKYGGGFDGYHGEIYTEDLGEIHAEDGVWLDEGSTETYEPTVAPVPDTDPAPRPPLDRAAGRWLLPDESDLLPSAL